MGAYLSTPITDKISCDKSFDNFSYGASSMQGWRKSQEDAHNCCPDFDKDTKTSYFAVYDGHGGAEVAQYCATHLPDYVKTTESYNQNNLSQALEDAFLGFDATITNEDVIKELKVLAEIDDDGEEEDVQGEIEETVMLNEEAHMPLEEVLAKYGGVESLSPGLREIYKKNEKFQSPAIKGRKETNGEEKPSEPVAGSSSSDANTTVSSNSSGTPQLVNGHSENENNENLEREHAKNTQTATSSNANISTCPDNSSNVRSNLQEQTVSSSDSSNKLQPIVSQSEVAKVVDSKSEVGGSGEPLATSSASRSSEAAGSSSSADVGSSAGSSDAVSGSASAATLSESSGISSTPEAVGSGSSAVGSSDVDPQPCSSSGRTHKSREHIIPEGDESESSFNSDEEDTEEEDSDELCEDDSEDEDDDDAEGDDEDDDDDGPMFSFIEEPGSNSGTTAVVALLRDHELYVANAGDSRCVVCRGGEAVDMSIDHKPDDEIEKTRITAAGGKISWDGRVNGGLNLSRAIGDHTYKKNESLPLKDQMISSLPDVKTLKLEDQDEFMVLACDGIWNFMTSADVIAYVKERIDKNNKLSSICEEMFDHCLSPDTFGDGTGCDNMTCIIIKFHFKGSDASNRKRSAVEEDSTEDNASKKCKIDSVEAEASAS